MTTTDDKGFQRRVMRRERKPRNFHSLLSESEKQQKSAISKRRNNPKKEKSESSTGQTGKRRGRPSKRIERNDSSIHGSIISASARTTADSLVSTKAVLSNEDAEPIYIEDDDDDFDSSQSNLIMDLSSNETNDSSSMAAVKMSESQSVPDRDESHVEDVIESVIKGFYL